jgi:hypothetical protein
MTEDELVALKLLRGAIEPDGWSVSHSGNVFRHGLPKLIFLSRNTQPTEREARAALCRALLNERPSRLLLKALAAAFEPAGESPLKAVLKKRTQGHSDYFRHHAIAHSVHMLRQGGKSYGDAIKAVATALNKSVKHIERIYGKMQPGRIHTTANK